MNHNRKTLPEVKRILLVVVFCLASLLAACTNGGTIFPRPTSSPCGAAQSKVDSLHSQIDALQELLPGASDKAGIVRQIHELQRQEEEIDSHCRTSDTPDFNACEQACNHNPKPEFNLSSTAYDYNGFMLNPDWSGVVNGPGYQDRPAAESDCAGFPKSNGKITLGTPPCTAQNVTFDPGPGFIDDVCTLGGSFGHARFGANLYHGHVNWTVATYSGTLHWGEHSNSVYDDDDYGFDLLRPDRAGETYYQQGAGIHVEINSDKTIDYFRSSW